jgi:uncharacterized damage-inducible protein DinB
MSTQVTPIQEGLLFWHYISSSIDQIFSTMDELSTEEINWLPLPHANSLYVLATHTLGNTAENLLEVLCGQPTYRQREAEFASQGESTEALRTKWQELRAQIERELAKVDNSALDQPRQHPRRGEMLGRAVLIVVARHCAEHMGQAFLTRDLILARRSV